MCPPELKNCTLEEVLSFNSWPFTQYSHSARCSPTINHRAELQINLMQDCSSWLTGLQVGETWVLCLKRAGAEDNLWHCAGNKIPYHCSIGKKKHTEGFFVKMINLHLLLAHCKAVYLQRFPLPYCIYLMSLLSQRRLSSSQTSASKLWLLHLEKKFGKEKGVFLTVFHSPFPKKHLNCFHLSMKNTAHRIRLTLLEI